MSPEAQKALEAAEIQAPRTGPYWERDAHMFRAGMRYAARACRERANELRDKFPNDMRSQDECDGYEFAADAIEEEGSMTTAAPEGPKETNDG